MRLQKNNSSSPLLFLLIFIFSIIIGFGIFRMVPFKPLQIVNDSIQRFFGKTTIVISREANSFRDVLVAYFSSPSQNKRIQDLEYEIRLKNVEIALYKNYAFENEKLKLILQLFNEKDLKTVPCEIIYRDGINPMNFTINKGKSNSLRLEQAIVYPLTIGSNNILKYQLVGRIQELSNHTSRVLSIFDDKSKISGRNLRNEVIGNVIYDSKKNELYLLTPNENEDFQNGDIILTSTFSTLPKNLIIGIVNKIESTASINKKVILATSIDILKINVVIGVQ